MFKRPEIVDLTSATPPPSHPSPRRFKVPSPTKRKVRFPKSRSKRQEDWISDEEPYAADAEKPFRLSEIISSTPEQLKTPARKVTRLQHTKDAEIRRLKEKLREKDAEMNKMKAYMQEVQEAQRAAIGVLEQVLQWKRGRDAAIIKLEAFSKTIEDGPRELS
ncbi:hypothetical protein FN846DRAFT_386369 [Sphaerosporella brunnea]|uniref:Uncharacterized protein n=1 Tax=Sphaerosporella brunnea TaxID=1250544 RepID=A0A5J5EHZ9_9PEZI|nr:hypothetical protein FN846DRAFT_386369 [Sphaerosporella brunnea]